MEIETECSSCKGTGVYVGMAERNGAGVVCGHCHGTGAGTFVYEPFTGRKQRGDITRVYLSSHGYVIGPEKIVFKVNDSEIEVDLSKKGVSYYDFLHGKMPEPIKELVCPVLQSQGECHALPGFMAECERLNGKWFSVITDCKMQGNKATCWDRFEEEKIKKRLINGE